MARWSPHPTRIPRVIKSEEGWDFNNPPTSVDSEIGRVGKNATIYGVGSIATKMVTFLLIPLYTQFLTPREVGVIVLLEVLELLHQHIAPLGMIRALWRFFFQAQKEGRTARLVSSSFFFMQITNGLVLVVLVLTAGFGARTYLSDADLTGLMRVFAGVLFLGLSRVFFITLLRIEEKAKQYVGLILVEILFLIALTLWFVIGLNGGLWGVILAKLIVMAVFFVYAVTHIVRHYGIHFHQPDIRQCLGFGFPLVFHGISLLILNMSDRLFVKGLISVEAAGIYGIAYKFGMILNMVLVTPFAQAWNPILYALENHPQQRVAYKKFALHFVQIGALIWLGVALAGKYLIMGFTTADYLVGIPLVPWVAFAYLLYGVQEIFKAGAMLNNATLKLTQIGLASAGINLVLNLVLIPYWGILGAAIATTLSYFVMVVLVLRLSQRFLPIDWLWHKMVLAVLLGWAFYAASHIETGSLWTSVLRDGAIFVSFPLVLTALRLVSVAEVKRAARLIWGKTPEDSRRDASLL